MLSISNLLDILNIIILLSILEIQYYLLKHYKKFSSFILMLIHKFFCIFALVLFFVELFNKNNHYKVFILSALMITIIILISYLLIHLSNNKTLNKNDYIISFKLSLISLIFSLIFFYTILSFKIYAISIIYPVLFLSIFIITYKYLRNILKIDKYYFIFCTILYIINTSNFLNNKIEPLHTRIFCILSTIFLLIDLLLKCYYLNSNQKEEIIKNNKKYIDTLTGIKNSNALKDYIINNIINNTNNDINNYSLILLNIDNFKNFNIYYSFSEGDLILKEMANFLINESSHETVYRCSADQFGILYEDSLEKSLKFAKKIVKNLKNASFNNYSLNVSIGISSITKDKNFDQLYKEAELALRNSKISSKNKISIFEDTLSDKILERLQMEKLLDEKIREKDFILYCQPKVSAITKKIVGAEILVRLKDNNGNFVSPALFIPIAEETGQIKLIDEIILEKSFEFIKLLESRGFKKSISINVSSSEFLKKEFSSRIKELIEKYDVDCSNIIIEITEHAFISNIDFGIETAKEIRELGISLSLDDFGTGYSSLNYLINLPVNEVKIDKSLIDDLTTNDRNFIFLSKLINLLHGIGTNVMVEGVETNSQEDKIIEAGGEFYQGYFAYKPLPIEDFISIIEKEEGK